MRLTLPLRFCSFSKHIPKKYIDRAKGVLPERVYDNRFGAPPLKTHRLDPEMWLASEERPWEYKNQMENTRVIEAVRTYEHLKLSQYVKEKLKDTWTEPIPDDKWMYYRGDRVQVMVGKDKGKQGIINYMVRERNWVFVAGLHIKYEPLGAEGQFLNRREQPLCVAKNEVSLVDPVDLKPTEVEWRYTEEGERVRVSMRSGHILEVSPVASETYEYKTIDSYVENPKDTKAKDAVEVTYNANTMLFEDEIMQEYDIKEDRKLGKTYWY